MLKLKPRVSSKFLRSSFRQPIPTTTNYCFYFYFYFYFLI